MADLGSKWEEVAQRAWQRHRRSEEAYLSHYLELDEALGRAAELADEARQADAITAFIRAYSRPPRADIALDRQAAKLMETTLPLAVLAHFVLWRSGIEATGEDDERLGRVLAALTIAYMAGKEGHGASATDG